MRSLINFSITSARRSIESNLWQNDVPSSVWYGFETIIAPRVWVALQQKIVNKLKNSKPVRRS